MQIVPVAGTIRTLFRVRPGHPCHTAKKRRSTTRKSDDEQTPSPDGRVVAIEIKATAAPSADDAVHLTWLRRELGDFACGIVFHTGLMPIRLGERISALPISCLWG